MSSAPPEPSGLLTAYQPFLGREENHSEQVLLRAEQLAEFPAHWRRERWPVVLPELADRVETALRAPAPSIWLALGESRDEGVPELETVARNAWDLQGDSAAAAGGASSGVFEAQGPAFVRAHWPASALCEALRAQGFELNLSTDAGRHCCNGLLWLATRTAERAPGPRAWVGFLHLPRIPEQREEHARLVAAAASWLDRQHG